MTAMLNDRMEKDILAAYGSLSSPNWSFAELRYANHPYTGLAKRLAEVGDIQETTDLNDDVSVALFVDFGAGKGVTIRLSLVGNYACVSSSQGSFLSVADLEQHAQTRRVLCMLQEETSVVVEPEELATKVDFDGRTSTVYEILFSSDGAIE